MKRLIPALLTCAVFAGQVAAQDERTKEPPFTPPIPPTSGTPPAADKPSGLTEAQIQAIVDRAVTKAVSEVRQQQGAQPSAQTPYQQAQAPPVQQPQVIYLVAPPQPAATPVQHAAAPVVAEPQYATILQAPPAHKLMLAHFGQKLATLGTPRLRTVQLAPTAGLSYAPAPVYATAPPPAQYATAQPSAQYQQAAASPQQPAKSMPPIPRK
jgi:hypothetical protein